jgi:hypothetical protein
VCRPRHANSNRGVDAFAAQLLNPLQDGVGIKSELGRDLDRATDVFQEGEFPPESPPERAVVDFWMPFGVGDDADMSNRVALDHPALQQAERVGIWTGRDRRIAADENEPPRSCLFYQSTKKIVEIVLGAQPTR